VSNAEEREREAGRRTVVRRGVREVDRVKDWEWEWEWAPGRRWGEREEDIEAEEREGGGGGGGGFFLVGGGRGGGGGANGG